MSIDWDKPIRVINFPEWEVTYIQELDNAAEIVHLIKLDDQTIAIYNDGVLPGEDTPWVENIPEWKIVATSKETYTSRKEAEDAVYGFGNKSSWDIECVKV
jgi:hypothetical protein